MPEGRWLATPTGLNHDCQFQVEGSISVAGELVHVDRAQADRGPVSILICGPIVTGMDGQESNGRRWFVAQAKTALFEMLRQTLNLMATKC